MLLAEMKIKITGEYETYEAVEDEIEDAFIKLDSYARQLFSEDWAKGLKLEIED